MRLIDDGTKYPTANVLAPESDVDRAVLRDLIARAIAAESEDFWLELGVGMVSVATRDGVRAEVGDDGEVAVIAEYGPPDEPFGLLSQSYLPGFARLRLGAAGTWWEFRLADGSWDDEAASRIRAGGDRERFQAAFAADRAKTAAKLGR